MTRNIRAELLKLVTIRTPFGLVLLAMALTGLTTFVIGGNSGTGSRMSTPALDTFAGQRALVTTTGFTLILAVVLGTIIVSTEQRHRTVTATYLAEPRRAVVLAAKLVAGLVAGAVLGLGGALTATAVALAYLGGGGHGVLLSAGQVIGYAAGTAGAAALLSAAGVAVGALVRSQVVGAIAVLVWGLVVEPIIGGAWSSGAPYLPFTAAASLAGSVRGGTAMVGVKITASDALTTAAAAAVLAGIAVVVSLVAVGTTARVDVG